MDAPPRARTIHAMSSAAQQRIKRTRVSEQLALELDIPAALDVTDVGAPGREQGEFALIAGDFARAQPHVADPWAASPYAWFKRLPPARRATTAHALLSRWLTHCGVPHTPRHGAGDHDLLIGASGASTRAQLRVSTLWSGGDFIFQGLKDGDYETALLLAIAPHCVYLWAPPKPLALAQLDSAGWISFPAGRAPAWLAPHGGTLTAATALLIRGPGESLHNTGQPTHP